MHFLNKVDIYSKFIISTEEKCFSLGKGLKLITKTVHKKFCYCTDIYVCDNFGVFCFISLVFEYQGNSRISSSLKPFFKFFTFCFTLQRQIKSATGKCNMSVLHYTVMLHFFNELAKVSLVLVYTMTDKLNTDQALIQITRLENVQDIGSAQRSQIDGPSHWSFPSL